MSTPSCAAGVAPALSTVPVGIARRLRDLAATAPHPDASRLVWLAWLDARAELFEAIASCAADPVLAEDAARMARSVRAQMTAETREGPFPYLSDVALMNTNPMNPSMTEVSR